MRLLVVLASFAAVIGLAVPAQADPSGDDAGFLAALKQAGITYTDGDKTVAAGKAVCDELDQGLSATDVVKNVRDGNPGLTQNNAAKFTVLAAGAYCPQYLQDPPPSPPASPPPTPWVPDIPLPAPPAAL